MKRFSYKAILASLAVLWCGQAIAWVPTEAGVWPDGSVPLVFWFSSTAPTAQSDWNAAASDAMAAWNNYLGRIQLTKASSTGQPGNGDGKNDLFFSDKVYGDPISAGILAVSIVASNSGQITETDIIFNSRETWSVYSGSAQATTNDFRRVAVHELGHLIGLGHPDEAGETVSSIMNAKVSDLELPTADDQAGAHGLYDKVGGAAPRILTAPQASSVTEGAATSLNVVAGGRGPFVYSWTHDGAIVPGVTGSAFTLAAAILSDAGNYAVTVSNANGSSVSAAAHLTVFPAVPPVIGLSAGEQRITVGSDYTIDGSIFEGSRPLRLTWKKNGVQVAVTDSSNLEIHNAQLSDTGDYTLTGTNVKGTSTAGPFKLIVVPGTPPRLTRGLQSAAVANGASVELRPTVEGSPPFTFQWNKNGVDLPGQSQASISFSPFLATDTGTYLVTVSNGFGTVTSDPAELTLLSSSGPIITGQSPSHADLPGADVRFSVSYKSDQPAHCKWLKDGIELKNSPDLGGKIWGADSSDLLIQNVAAADAGVYSVIVSNETGSIQSRDIRLTVVTPPKPVILVQPAAHIVMPGDKVTLTVEARRWFLDSYQQSFHTGYSYQWFKDSVAIAGKTDATLEFIAQSTDAGQYFVRVMSAGGTTDSDVAEVKIVTAPPLLKRQPSNLLIDGSDAETMRLAGLGLQIIFRNLAFDSGYRGDFLWQTNGVVVPAPFTNGFTPGTYTLTMTQNGVSQTTQPFSLGYAPPMAPIFVDQPSGTTADFGATLDIYPAVVAYGPVAYQWAKDGVPIAGATEQSYHIPHFSATDAGKYTVTASGSAGSTTSDVALLDLRTGSELVIIADPVSQTVPNGSLVSFEVAAGGGTLNYQWLKDGHEIVGATTDTYRINSAAPNDAGAYSVVVDNGLTSKTSRPGTLRVLTAVAAPLFTLEPSSQNVKLGGFVIFSANAFSDPGPSHYQWRKNGVDIMGANSPDLQLNTVRAEDAGEYCVVASNDSGSATSRVAILSIGAEGRLVNLSTRASVGSGDNVVIAGFVVAGTQPRTLLIRGVGQQLGDYGVTGFLQNPKLQIMDAQSHQVAMNDGWAQGSEGDADRSARMAAIVTAGAAAGAFPLRTDTHDAALMATLTPGVYSAILSGVADTKGVALVEIYETGGPDDTRLVNLSTRAYVGSNDGILISGLVLSGNSRRLLIRAVGPGLADLGVSGALPDPLIQVYQGAAVIAANDNWGQETNAAETAQVAANIGAFPLKPGSLDSALLIDLQPGAYSVHLQGVGGSTGIALMEVYEVQTP